MHDFSEIKELIRDQSFPDYVEKIDFLEFYDKHIGPKKGGGRDRISPRKYRRQFQEEVESIRYRCITGTYKFSPYNEKLILKGRHKFPRIISIPNVRDRFVFSLLNSYLQQRLDQHRRTANSYIKDLQIFRDSNKDKDLYFFKTDFTSFFDSINHQRIIEILSLKLDIQSIALIRSAITTPTLVPGEERIAPNTKGIPQGLSISSILTEEYMKEFDSCLNEAVRDRKGSYVRYVDDIFILTPQKYDWKTHIETLIEELNLFLELTSHKTKTGRLGYDATDYIGYSFTKYGTGIRLSNVRAFSDRIANRCVKFRQQLNNSYMRPKYFAGDDEFIEFSKFDINLLISGFRVNNHNYGWLPYFQQITDLRVLYELDNMVLRLTKNTPLYDNLNSLVQTYHALRRKSGVPYVINFDDVTSIHQKRAILMKMGRMSNDERLSDLYIEHRFAEMIESLTSNANKDLKELS